MILVNDSDKRPTVLDKDGKPTIIPTTVDFARPGIGRVFCEVGKTVNVPDEFCRPGRSQGGGRTASVIEMLAPQLRPVDPAELEAWSKPPAEPVVAKKAAEKITNVPSVEDLVANGMPPAAARKKVAAMLAEKSLQEQAAEDGE